MGPLAHDYRIVLLWLAAILPARTLVFTLTTVVLWLEDSLPALTLVLTFIGPPFFGCLNKLA